MGQLPSPILAWLRVAFLLSLALLVLADKKPDGPPTDPRLAHPKEGVYSGRECGLVELITLTQLTPHETGTHLNMTHTDPLPDSRHMQPSLTEGHGPRYAHS